MVLKTPRPKTHQRGRPASVEIKTGMIFGNLVIRGHRGSKWRTECIGITREGKHCGKIELVPTAYLTRKNNPKTNCGCQTYKDANPYPREKSIWHNMNLRCTYTKHVSWKDYGGRGIRVCPEWNKENPKGWDNFIAFMGPAPTKRHSIDRVNPNLGYQPYQEDGRTIQTRWATSKEQANNQRHHWAAKKHPTDPSKENPNYHLPPTMGPPK